MKQDIIPDILNSRNERVILELPNYTSFIFLTSGRRSKILSKEDSLSISEDVTQHEMIGCASPG